MVVHAFHVAPMYNVITKQRALVVGGDDDCDDYDGRTGDKRGGGDPTYGA